MLQLGCCDNFSDELCEIYLPMATELLYRWCFLATGGMIISPSNPFCLYCGVRSTSHCSDGKCNLSKSKVKQTQQLVIEIVTLLREITCHIGSHSVNCHPPDSSDFPTFTPAEAGTRFSDPGGMQDWVDLVVVISQDSLPIKDGHVSQK